jgi:transposase-like protein
MPRQQASDKYNISPHTLKHWIDTDKMAINSDNLYKKLSHQVKRSIVRAVESKRLSIKEAQMTYSIRSASTIRKWIKQFQQENNELALVNDSEMKKKKPAKGNSTDNNQDIKALQKALEDAQLKIAALNTLIDVAEDQLKINIRKKPGAKQSND